MADEMNKQEVTVVDVKIPFMSMVVLMVKFAVASIPALLIISFIFGLFTMLFGSFFHGMGRF